MTIVCLDMEGVGTPENGDAVADKEGRLDSEWTACDEMGRFVEVIEL